jgi:hypothetical protein
MAPASIAHWSKRAGASGIGDAISVDGGKAGGAKDTGYPFVNGQDGLVEVHYIRHPTSF